MAAQAQCVDCGDLVDVGSMVQQADGVLLCCSCDWAEQGLCYCCGQAPGVVQAGAGLACHGCAEDGRQDERIHAAREEGAL